MSNLRFTNAHEWVRMEGDVAVVGISDYAQEQLGDVVFVELPDVGASFAQSGQAAVIESVKAASEIYAPVSGEVTEVNMGLPDDLDALGEDPFGRGWMIRLAVSDISAADALLDETAYRNHCQSAGH